MQRTALQMEAQTRVARLQAQESRGALAAPDAGRGGKDPPWVPGGAWPCPHLESGPLSSRL